MRIEAPIHVEHKLLAAPAFGDRAAPDRDKHLVGGDPRFLAVGLFDDKRALLRGEALRLGRCHGLHAEFAEAAHDRPREFGVILRQDAFHGFDHSHLGAHLGEGDAEFQSDIAAADHSQLFRHFRQRQRFGG